MKHAYLIMFQRTTVKRLAAPKVLEVVMDLELANKRVDKFNSLVDYNEYWFERVPVVDN